MFKRVENNRENEYPVPAKRPKYDAKKGIVGGVPTKGRDGTNKKFGKPDDVWGDDFAEEDIEEMDFVASQACLQEEIALTQTNAEPQASLLQRHNSAPSTSKAGSKVNNINKSLRLSLCTRNEKSKEISQIASVNYKDFEDKLMNRQVYNSTFKLDESVILPESKYVKELEKLKLENKKLLNDFITKEGEAVFLRNQLQQTQLRVETDRLEKTRFIEEQENRHRTEINAICKEKEYLKTQLELQAFEVGNLMERCKLLETGNVKLTEPCAISLNTSTNKSKFNSSMNRTSVSTAKPVKLRESCVQVALQDKNSYILKTWSPYYPLANISKLVYDTPQPEKSIVNIQVIEKTGRRNLPILQEEDTFRIFENPELVKPVTTMVDEKRLSMEFILPEIAALQRKTSSELESENSICIMNKLVSTARELILNVIIVLQTIFQAMRNDDIRDMNDIYFSDLYSSSDFNGKSVCDANAWHECERGVEVRRVFGVISYVTLESTYLSKYIAGKTPLLTERDESYRSYSRQMVRYDMWLEKGQDFEMLRMILQFIVLVGSTRRAHQFSGLMCAIMMIICNVHKKVEYCSLGMEYVYQIFKEIVFSRPLPYCYSFLTRIMVVFIKSATYLKKLCVNSQLMAVNNWKGSLHFTPDACPLQIFLAQVENHHFDTIVALDITEVLLQFIQYVLQTDAIPLRSETLESCNCCMKLLRFTMRTLSKCAEANLSAIGNFDSHHFPSPQKDCCKLKSICPKHSATPRTRNKKCVCEVYQEILSDANAWTIMKQRQVKILRDGIRFLAHLAICDPDFVIRLSDIEDSFHLFMRNISNFDDFSLHENEQEAMDRIKQTFIFDKVPQSEIEECTSSSTRQLDILSNFEKRPIQPAPVNPKRNENHNKFLTTIRSLYNSRMELSNH
ncbi:mutagen-sensitive 304 [Lasioglossum baleicum]|uniref:mutagen-sensitive 304 n=1 Tax=Lasioglossum baleicum TaxID=434251 RepID=UPI003FCE23D7